MKTLLKIVLVLVLVLVVGLVAAFIYIDRIAKVAVEKGGTYALGVDTRLDSISVGVLAGKVGLKGLSVANPEGYSTPAFMSLGSGGVEVSLGTLRKDVVEIPVLELHDIKLNLEKKNGKSNYQVILDNLKKFESTDPQADTSEQGKKKFVIRKIVITNVEVTADLLPLGGSLTRTTANIPKIEMTDIGSDGQGVKMGQLVNILTKAMLSAVANKLGDIPGGIAGELGDGLKSLASLGKFKPEVVGQVSKKVTDAAGKVLEGAGKVLEGAGDKVKEGVGGVIEGVGGLLRRDKDKAPEKQE